MKSIGKRLLPAICLLTALLLSLSAAAAQANVTYSGNAGKFIFAPGSDASLTDLFPDLKDVMPGDVLTQRITVRNDANDRVKVRIYLRSLGAVTENDAAFLEQLRLSVQKVGETPMFDAAASETDGLRDRVCLGTLYSGGQVDLDVTLTVPTETDDRFQKNYGELKWEFTVEELPVSPRDPVPPDTGVRAVRHTLPLLPAAAAVLCLWRLIRNKRKKRVED